jgi:hypothetical protein
MILTAHYAEKADHENGSEPSQRANCSMAVRWVLPNYGGVE